MNIYLIAFIIAALDTYYTYKYFLKFKNNTFILSLLCFLISFYISLKILEYLKTLVT